MLHNKAALAIIPKAKAIAARRLTKEDYAQLMRKHSVLEITACLQQHPYFEDSLKGLSQANLHRAQIEEALRKDAFYKYEKLIRYSFHNGRFGTYFLMHTEVEELLTKLRLLSMGFRHHYIVHLPGFLLDKTTFSLLKLAKAETPEDCLQVLTGTPYEKVLREVMPKSGEPLDYLKCEHTFLTYYYQVALNGIRQKLSAQDAKKTQKVFLQRAEIYNLDLLYRTKAFYKQQLPFVKLQELLLPFYDKLTKKQLLEMAAAKDLPAFLQLYTQSRAYQFYGDFSADFEQGSDLSAMSALQHTAEKLLHFSQAPQTVVIALLMLSEIQRNNIIHIIEGVRYGLPPNQIESFLQYV